jgi:FkbM family methyltransferase
MEKLTQLQSTLKLNHGSFLDETIEQELCYKYIDKNDVVLELGGNIGRVSLIIASIVNNENLTVIESDYENCVKLKENKELNNFTFNIVNGAISNTPLYQLGWDTYTKYEIEKNISESIFNKEHIKNIKNITTFSYKDFINLVKLSFNTLVIDCEGSFYKILKEDETILDNIEKIIIENDYKSAEHKKYVNELLVKKGFITVENIDLNNQFHKFHPDKYIQKGFYEVKIKDNEYIHKYKLMNKNIIYEPILYLKRDTHINFQRKFKPEFIDIKDSLITGAGKGAFSNKLIKKNRFVGIYLGKKQSKFNQDEHYTFRTQNSNNEIYYINAENKEESNWTRYINHNDNYNIIQFICTKSNIYTDHGDNQVCFDGTVMFFTKRDILPGEELYISYNPDYTNIINNQLKIQNLSNINENKNIINNNDNNDNDNYNDYYTTQLSDFKEMDECLFEDNNSNQLLIIFSGFGLPNKFPIFIFRNFLKPYKCDKLFIRDLYKIWFLYSRNQIDKDSNVTRILNLIRTYIKPRHTNIYTMGCSSGGYASILFGHLLCVDKCIAFSPQTLLGSKSKTKFNDERFMPNQDKIDNIVSPKYLNLSNFIPFNMNTYVYYSGELDSKHAYNIAHKNTHLVKMPGSTHELALYMKRANILKDSIDNLFTNNHTEVIKITYNPTLHKKNKIAFCFLIIDDINQIELWKRFFKNIPTELYNIYIHCKFPDKFNDSFFAKFKIKKHVNTEWGVIEDAIALLYEEAMKDPDNQYFIPLSESTIATQSFKFIYNYLFANKQTLKSYIKYWKIPFNRDFKNLKNLYKKKSINPLFIKHIKYEHYYKVHSWYILNRHHANIVVNDTFYRDCFKNHIASSENYIMYILSVNNEYENIDVIQVTGEDWSNPIQVKNPKYENRGRRPRTIDIVDNNIAKIYLQDCYLFGRKFSKTSNIHQFIKMY